ncbi:EpsG-like putative glucosyltransferase [Frischella perrara]|uniref:EpsG family n=1 Tax=Frischella perrara TaxID=1267021 RepID=A0A0A7S8P0_FRIPE|nr:EpsG family protein [Frischella perrara]AJA45661.1 EpsG family [Frischella perrara]PWV60744.1 EpsG-like putative glucosyltransferase [Frischella perrara]
MKVKKRTLINLFNLFLISLLSLIVAFKGNTRDTGLYFGVFKNINKFSSNPIDFYKESGVEFGFGIINHIVHFFTDNFTIYSYIISFITFLFIYLSTNLLKIRFIDVLLFYLPNLFITQQLMQIRQGLASAIVINAVILLYIYQKKIKCSILLLIAISIHSMSIAYLTFFVPQIKKYVLNQKYLLIRLILWFILIFILCRIVMQFSLLQNISSRINDYSVTEFASSRSFFELANIRAMIYFILFALTAKYIKNDSYLTLLYIYSTSLALRLGFYDFYILSGRLGIAFGYSEIFLLAISLKFVTKKLFYFVALFYLIIHCYLTLNFQVPYMVQDYFSSGYLE